MEWRGLLVRGKWSGEDGVEKIDGAGKIEWGRWSGENRQCGEKIEREDGADKKERLRCGEKYRLELLDTVWESRVGDKDRDERCQSG